MQTVIYSCITLVIGILLTYSFTSFRADKLLRLQKLEELYIAFNTHRNSFTDFLIEQMKLTDPAAVKAFTLDKKRRDKDAESDYASTVMLVNIYFPELVLPLKAVEDVKNELVVATGKYVSTLIEQGEYRAALGRSLMEFNDASREMREQIIAEATAVKQEKPFGSHRLTAFFRRSPDAKGVVI